MRKALAILVLISLFAQASQAQPFRVATWQVPDVLSTKGVTNLPISGLDAAADIAATLGGLDADAIILYGISDGQVLKSIGEMMKPKKHSVALHMVFRHGGSKGPLVGEPIAILSPRPRMHSKTFNWADSGRIDYPGGFGFASFRHGPGVVAVYVAGLPGSLTNLTSSGDKDYFSRKREYAAQYVNAHIGWLASTYTNPVFATYLTGDINPGPKRMLKDECVGLLEKAGFRTFLLGTTTDKSGIAITNLQGMDRVLDPVFTKNVEFIASRQITRPASEHPVVVCDLTLKAPGVAAATVPAVKKVVSSSKTVSIPEPSKPVPVVAPAPVPEPVVSLVSAATPPAREKKPEPPPAAPPVVPSTPVVPAVSVSTTNSPAAPPLAAVSSTAEIVSPTVNWPLLHEQWFAPVMAAGGAVLMAAVFFFAHATRRRQAPLALTPRPGDAMFVEVGSAGARPENLASVGGEQAVVSEATTSTDNAHNVHNALWRTPRIDFGNQEHADPVRAGLMANLRRLMREKLFVWLSHQRNHLIDSHETGTRQVLGLEERLEKITEKFQNRLISQEERIAEMDKELQAKDKLIRDAMKANGRQEERPSNSR